MAIYGIQIKCSVDFAGFQHACCLLDLRLSALLCAGFPLLGLAAQDGWFVLTYHAPLRTVLSAADAIGAGPSAAPLRGLCGLHRAPDATPSALLMKCLAGAVRLACASQACCAGGLYLAWYSTLARVLGSRPSLGGSGRAVSV